MLIAGERDSEKNKSDSVLESGLVFVRAIINRSYVFCSISKNFSFRVNFLISASRRIASCLLSYASLWTSLTGPRPRVYFAPAP